MTKLLLLPAILAIVAMIAPSVAADGDKTVPPALNFKMNDLAGKPVDLAQYQGKVVLIVNVASKCGLTPQYTGLQALYEKYKNDGFVIVGVPANDFGKQEPGSDSEILKFCEQKYNVTFPVLSKVSVKGGDICPLYKHLTSKETDPKYSGDITWNFEKFLIGRSGEIVGRFKPRTTPESADLVKAIETELKKK